MRKKIEKEIVKDSSPGYPYAVLGGTNKVVLEKHGDYIWDLVLWRLNQMVKHRGDYHNMTPEQLIRAGLCDPVKGFIKDEPHNEEKVRTGRLRMIASVSLVDQIIERLLFSIQNKNEIEMWEFCPSKPGLGLHDEGLLAVADSLKRLLRLRGEVMCTDVSGWDWSVQDWELRADAECRWRLAGVRENSLFAFLCRVNAKCVANSVYVDLEGNLWAQTMAGVQNSGRYCTSSSNSRMRVIASMAARVEVTGEALVDGKIGVDAMGDDSVEVSLKGVKEVMEEFGHVIKHVEVHHSLEGIDFCSHVFNDAGFAAPTNPSKTAYRFFSRKTSEIETLDLWTQLSWFLRHASDEVKENIEKHAMARIVRAINLNGKEETKPGNSGSSAAEEGRWETEQEKSEFGTCQRDWAI
jgi:hypothetical protein